jgi:sugar fermentation stimulation protein A
MKFKQPLQEGTFLKRYKRFFADILLAGKTEVAHVANTGSLKSANVPGQACLVRPSDNPERKLRFTLEAIKAVESGCWIGVNTAHPNHLVKEAFAAGMIPHWKEWKTLQAEVKLNPETRIDFMFTKGEGSHLKKHFVEVKNVTLADAGVAKFPDAVTERGQKHLRELMKLVAEGHSAEIFFTVQRDDCREVRPADEIDPEYGRLLREASARGVKVRAYVVKVSLEEIVLTDRELPVLLK